MLRIQNSDSHWCSFPHLSFFLSFLLFPISKDYPSPFPLPLFDFSIFCPKNRFWPFKNLKENQKVQIWFAYNFNIPLTPISVFFYPFVIYNLWCTKHSHTSTITHRHTLNRKRALKIISLPCCSLYLYFFSLLNLLSSFNTSISFAHAQTHPAERRSRRQTTWSCRGSWRRPSPSAVWEGSTSWGDTPESPPAALCRLYKPTETGRKGPGTQTYPPSSPPSSATHRQSSPCSEWWSLPRSPAQEWWSGLTDLHLLSAQQKDIQRTDI